MTTIYLSRHGETIWHAENRYAGGTDIPLTSKGKTQAGILAKWAETANLTAIYSSILSRAVLTAEQSAKATGLPLTKDARLRELDFGQGEGLTRPDMEKLFPEALAHFLVDPARNPLPGGEDPYRAADRFMQCLYDIVRQHPGGRVLVVAHTTSIRLSLCCLLGIPLAKYRQTLPALRNCSLTELSMTEHAASLMQYNTPVSNAPMNAPTALRQEYQV